MEQPMARPDPSTSSGQAPSTSSGQVPSILVVDDTPANLHLLAGMLKDRGYKARPVPSGKLALQAAKSDPPDLILLDITMPEMNGYEVCRRLKADEHLKEIPIIFISALNETMDKVTAFGVGGVDYVAKPFQFEEVEARVKTHLQLRRQQRELQESYEKLRALEALRDSLVHMIVHDLRTPLNGIYGFLQLLEMEEKEQLSEKGVKYLERVVRSTVTLMDMISTLLDVSKMEAGEMKLHLTECDLAGAAHEVLTRVEALKRGRRVVLDAPGDAVTVIADAELVTRVIQNLVGNALKFAPDGSEVRIGIEPGEGQVRVFVRDSGPGIPPEYHARIFEKFGQVEARAQQQKFSTGLGLTFCKLAVEAHGGHIGVESTVGQGSTFWFVLPRGKS
jgi:two-component system sensor histidine kinase/response regulator